MTDPFSSPPDEAPSPVSAQIQHSGLGEIVGFAISIGAVYFAEQAFPKQMEHFVERLGAKIGEWRGTSAAAQKELAQQITDVGLMNLAGISNMSVQFALRRHGQKPEERLPLSYELGRVVSGRAIGTVGAIGALALAERHAPRLMNGSEKRIASWLGGTPASHRFGELMMSNLVQSFGGIAGNVPAQLLYDRLVSPAPAKQR